MPNEQVGRRRRRAAFAVLQDKFAHARRLACSPAMDLVALLTVDGQLLVHRAVSWQRLLHVKPSDVVFEAESLAWSPDGRVLALGCADGEVVRYDVETGAPWPELRALRALHAPRHSHKVTAMHWTRIGHDGEASQSYFGDRASRLLDAPSAVPSAATAHATTSSAQQSVLVTADAGGKVVLWWGGSVCVAKIDVGKLVAQFTGGSLVALGVAVDGVQLAPDLSRLFVMLVASSDADSQTASDEAAATTATAAQHQLVALDLRAIRAAQDEIGIVVRTVDECHIALNQLVLSMRQMAVEWKTSTRIFELKMGLIGSLYEKYACEDPPQVDMLSVVASGITSPALAQYFAQDIQEMSVDRMQKLLLSGCQTLTTLAEQSMKADLVRLLFHLSELRGRAKWKRTAFEETLGIAVAQLDELVAIAQELLIGMEIFAQAVQETQQDFLLFFHWLLERIRIHTNAPTAGPGGSAPDAQGGATKSLLNQRRLCGFLQRAALEAQRFREEQPPHSKYRVETTFGNLVSKQLVKPKASTVSQVDTENAPVSIALVLEDLESKWFAITQQVTESVSNSVAIDPSGCFAIGDDVEEYSFHCRHESEAGDEHDDSASHGVDTLGGKDTVSEDEDEEDEEEEDDDELEAVDWDSLASFAAAKTKNESTRSVMMLGVRLRSSHLLLLRATWSLDARDELGARLAWDALKLSPNAATTKPSGTDAELQGFDFYGDRTSGREEQLAFLIMEPPLAGDSSLQRHACLYIQQYDNLAFAPLTLDASAREASVVSELHGLATLPLPPSEVYRARQLAAASSNVSVSIPRVIANAKRGIVCVSVLANRLTILDAEEDEDDDEADDSGDDGEDSDDAEPRGDVELLPHKGHECDSIEVDL